MGFQMEFIWKFGAKNVEFLTSRMFASSMIRVFPSLEHSAGHVRIPETMGGLSGVPYWHL